MVRWFGRVALLLVVLLAVALAVAWWLVRGSLPTLEGDLALRGLVAPVSISRDAVGVVTIDADSETDAMRALGYVHGQERYFEMDLMRRMAAGELSALFGARALETDRAQRNHRMRARVEATLADIAGDRLPLLQAYADGVNAGRDALPVRPWPYLLLRQQPAPWTPADSALAGHAMYFDLQDAGNARELALWRVRPHLPPALFELVDHDGSRWDAPLLGHARGDATLPAATAVDLRTLPMPTHSAALETTPARQARGSNNFAVSGELTADGRAIVADDMHLGLRAPNIWFRARLRYRDPRAPGGRVDVSGFTLPGLPAVVVGSNGHVAWGFTNSYIDTADWRHIRPCTPLAAQEDDGAGAPSPAARAGVDDAACEAVTTHRETLAVAGGGTVTHLVEESPWGPLLHRQPDGSALALRWVAHLPGALNFGLADLATVADLDAALAVADRVAMPTQNLVVGDRAGRIAWRLLGPIPARGTGCSRRLDDGGVVGNAAPAAAAESATDVRETVAAAGPAITADKAASTCAPWSVSTDVSPLLASPTARRLWTANGRVVDGALLARVGDAGYALGARGQQIRDQLHDRERLTEGDLLAIQLDDRALLLAPWWGLLRDAAAAPDAGPGLRALAGAAAAQPTRAAVDDAAYRIVRGWRLAVHARIADGLLAPARAALGPDVPMPATSQLEGVVWPLLEQRPAHLLPRRFSCAARAQEALLATCTDRGQWQALLEDAAVEVRDELATRGPLAERTWGERNTANICHPLASAVPLLGQRLLCMPAEPLPGDSGMPRVQGPGFGASQRMVVAPGHEADGIAHMPGGQSGHPLSPYWGAGHADWVQGRASPFLPQPPVHTLALRPAALAH